MANTPAPVHPTTTTMLSVLTTDVTLSLLRQISITALAGQTRPQTTLSRTTIFETNPHGDALPAPPRALGHWGWRNVSPPLDKIEPHLGERRDGPKAIVCGAIGPQAQVMSIDVAAPAAAWTLFICARLPR